MSPKPGIRKPRKTPNPAGAGDEGWRVGKGLLGEIAAIAAGLKYFAAQNGGTRVVASRDKPLCPGCLEWACEVFPGGLCDLCAKYPASFPEVLRFLHGSLFVGKARRKTLRKTPIIS